VTCPLALSACFRRDGGIDAKLCADCRDDIWERAALIADGCKVGQAEGLVRAISQAKAAMPGQLTMEAK
jgi:hypothetical protein